MFWILTGAFCAGLLATSVLLWNEVGILWIRYSISVIVAYLAFLLLIRLWLWYIGRVSRVAVDGTDPATDVAAELLANLDVVAAAPQPLGGGGEFGGAGATSSWSEAAIDDGAAAASAPSSDLPGCGIDVDEAAVVVVLAALVFALVAAGLYVIWAAPVILAEAAFEAALAAALARSAKRIDRPGWAGKVWRATALPFVVVLLIAALAGATAQSYCPEATRLREVVACLRAQ